MSEQHPPPSRIDEDEISLVDLWLTLVKNRKIFYGLFSLTLTCGLVFSQLRPTVYTVSSMIEIGTLIEGAKRVPLESVETVKTKLEMVLDPIMLEEAGENPLQDTFTVSIPNSTNLVFVQSLVEKKSVNNAKSLQQELISRLVKDHDRILKLYRSQVNAELDKAKKQLNLLQDKRLQQLKTITLEGRIQEAKAALTRLSDPVIINHKIKELDIQLDTNKQKQASLKEEEAKKKKKKVTQQQTRKILQRQISETKQQIAQSTGLEPLASNEEDSGPRALALLITNNDLHRNRYRLTELEERLFVVLENQKSTLQRDIYKNERTQVYQTNIIAQQKTNKKIFEIENRLKKAQQIIEIAKFKASSAEKDALHEQQLALKTLEIDKMQAQLDTLTGTQAITPPLRSRKPIGSSSLKTAMLSVVLGIALGIIGVFVQTFIQKVRSHQIYTAPS